MKRSQGSVKSSRNKKVACTVSASALMLGVSSAATVGLHFQVNYCASAPYTGFPVTMTAFGIESNGWENLTQMDTGYGCTPNQLVYSLSEVIDTTTSSGGLNPLPNGSLIVDWTAATANFSGFAGYAGYAPSYDYNGDYPGPNITPTGEEEIYSSFLRDGYNFGPGSTSAGTNTEPVYLVDVTGLKSLFTNTPFVVELIAAADSMQALTNAYVIDVPGLATNSVTYPSTPPITYDNGGEPWVRGHGGGLSTVSGVLNTDHIQLMSNHPMGGGNKTVGYDNAGTISGFIVTDKPVVTMPPQPISLVGPEDTIVLSAYAIGVPPLSYQWQLNGSSIAGATNLSYSFTNLSVGHGGNYTLVVTNLYGAATSKVATVTVDLLTETPATGIIYDSNPTNTQNNGQNMGAVWEASSTDSHSVTRTGVMDFVASSATNYDGISVEDSSAFNGPTGTITFWMQSAGTQDFSAGGFAVSLICRTNGGMGNDFVLAQLDGAGYLDFFAPNFGNAFTSTGTVSDNNWHFLALTFDQTASGGAALYIDGALDTTNANSIAWTWPTGQPLEIGYSSDTYFGDYTGLLDDVRYYSKILSSSQIATIKTGALVDTNDLQMQFNFTAPPNQGVTLTWKESSAVLQSAPTVSGPWSNLNGISSPYTIIPTATQQFFRYKYAPKSQVSNPYLM